jgi:AraC family transcriptional regulator
MGTWTKATRRAFAKGPVTVSSDSVQWSSLLAREADYTGIDEITTLAVPDVRIAFFRNHVSKLESRSGSMWATLSYLSGSGFVEPPGSSRQFRWNSRDQPRIAVRTLYLSQQVLSSAANTLQQAGCRHVDRIPEIPFLDDPHLTNFSAAVISAVRAGAPDFYAQAAAQWIAAHLLIGPSKSLEWRQSLSRERISDYRLIRVLEYVDAHLSDRLDLRVLSKEAGISPFHFAALFRKAVGSTPHRHVTRLRMETARSMLRDTDKSTLDIALTCGFGSASHFSSSFRRQFSQSPSQYRSLNRSNAKSGHA